MSSLPDVPDGLTSGLYELLQAMKHKVEGHDTGELLSGTIGGWTVDYKKIYKTTAYIHSGGFISFGDPPPSAYGNNAGVWVGWDPASKTAKMSLYTDVNNYFQFADKVLIKAANFSLNASGNIIATGGTIGGWTLASNKISIPGIELDQANNRIRAYTGSNYVDLTAAGLIGYDSVLGMTFRIPTDGSAPEFSSGIIKECIYEIYTSGVIRTDADPIANGGLLINNMEMKGYNSSGLKLLQFIYDGTDQGDAYIGDYDSANDGIKYDHSAGILYVEGQIIITGGSGIANLSDAGALAIGDDLDDVPDGSTYGRVGFTYISGGQIILTSGVTGLLPVANSDAKCTDPNADQTSVNTAADTEAVDGVIASILAGWRYGATTYIDGGDIYTGTITANKIDVTNLAAIKADCGAITAGTLSSSDWAADAGLRLDLNNKWLKMGGSNVTADGAAAGIFLGLDTDYKVFIGNTLNFIKWDGSEWILAGKMGGVVAGDYVESAADTERELGDQDSYVKVKEAFIGRGGTWRIKFDIHGVGSGHYVWGEIRKNESPHGTPQSTLSGTYVTFSEDLDFEVGDFCQLYCKWTTWGPVTSRNFRVCCANPIIGYTILD